MNTGDLNKVWEIKTLKRKPREEDSRKTLDRIAKQVQPIMRKHNWRVKVLSEFYPNNRALLGLNVGRGIHVKLRLRRPNNENEFLPFHEVLDTMLHELCHNAHGPHNASFYNLWDELRKECEDLINKGISGSGQGFDLPGKQLGGNSRKKPLLSSLRLTALAAAENRARIGSLMPSGPKKIGGNTSIMSALSPVQAAAMAAERRLRDNIWCGSEFGDVSGEDECADSLPESSDKGCCSEISRNAFDRPNVMNVQSRKRIRELDSGKQESTFIDLTEDVLKPESTFPFDQEAAAMNDQKSGEASISSSISSDDPINKKQCGAWQCTACTLLNPPLAPICDLCGTKKPKDENVKTAIWSCRFCTLENDEKLDKCGVCGVWRYSYGPPVASSAPHLGT